MIMNASLIRATFLDFFRAKEHLIVQSAPIVVKNDPTGTEVYATGNGKVEMVEKSYWGYGNTIIINHGFGYKTKYSHLHQFKIKKGDKVKRGQLIATIGNTGKSTAPHLHYEVHKNDRPVNPVHFFFNDLSPEEYQLILELSAQPSQSMD